MVPVKQIKKHRGFTLLEVMAIIAVLGILSAVAIQTYSNFISKSKLVEAVLIFDTVRTNVLSDYYVSAGFPDNIMSARAGAGVGSAQVNTSDNAVATTSDVVTQYWYYQNEDAGIGWFGLQLDESFMPSCMEECRLHIGFKENNNSLAFYCGLWNSEDVEDIFPLNVLPSGCQETCVRCQLNEGDGALDYALNNPANPASSDTNSNTASNNSSSGSSSGNSFANNNSASSATDTNSSS